MSSLPGGTVTFLFTDIQGSTDLWEQHPGIMPQALQRHDLLLRQSIALCGGYPVKSTGDGCLAAFETAIGALTAALTAQRALCAEPWPSPLSLRVRMGLHTGDAVVQRDGDYFGQPLNRAARLMAAGYGGQILLSDVTRQLCHDTLPDGVTLLDLGEHRLRDLARPERIFQVCHPDLPADFPRLKTLDSPDLPNNLPLQVTSFIGREKEIADLKTLLTITRLLTLTGTGGCGKTRLSLQIAADMLEQYPDGAWFVELAPLNDLSLVTPTVAQALGVEEKKGLTREQALLEFLKSRRLLLILDNCEHLVGASANLSASILRTCPGVRVLATSRERLGVAGELTYRVPSLSLPEPQWGAAADIEALSQYEAVRLFIDRALMQKRDFSVTNTNAPALAELCHRLDGIPLAIELAASRIRSLSVEEINARLDSRFRILTGGDRAALPRQQTLRALVDWSYDLLSDAEKTLLARLSVFVGGWTLDAAEKVCADAGVQEGAGYEVSGIREDSAGTPALTPDTQHLTPIEDWEILDLLTGLLDKSLVVADDTEQGSPRYRLLETIRQYAAEKRTASGEGETVRDRHRDWCLAFVEEAETHLRQADQAIWLARLDAEHDNARAALMGCLNDSRTEGIVTALQLCGTMARFWDIRGHFTEGREWIGRALAGAAERNISVPPELAARVFARGGTLAMRQADFPAARSLYEKGLALARETNDLACIGLALNGLGNIACDMGDYAEAQNHFEESCNARRTLGDTHSLASSLVGLGNVAYYQGNYEQAVNFYAEGLAIRRQIGDTRGIASILNNLSNIAMGQGNFEKAQSLLEESLLLCRELGDRQSVANALANLGLVAFHRDDLTEARSRTEESLSLLREIGDKRGIATGLSNLAAIALKRNDIEEARSLSQESLALLRALGDKRGAAASTATLAHIALQESDYTLARPLLRDCLLAYSEMGDRRNVMGTVDELAALAYRDDDPITAVTFWAAAEGLRQHIDFPLSRSEEQEIAARQREAHSILGDDRYSTARATGHAMTWDEVIAFALQWTSYPSSPSDRP